MAADHPSTRNLPLDPATSAILFIDVQNFSVRRDGGEFKDVSDAEIEGKYGYYFKRIHEVAIPNMQRLRIRVRIDRDRPHPELPRGADDPAGNLPAIGDEEALDHVLLLAAITSISSSQAGS